MVFAVSKPNILTTLGLFAALLPCGQWLHAQQEALYKKAAAIDLNLDGEKETILYKAKLPQFIHYKQLADKPTYTWDFKVRDGATGETISRFTLRDRKTIDINVLEGITTGNGEQLYDAYPELLFGENNKPDILISYFRGKYHTLALKDTGTVNIARTTPSGVLYE